MVEECELLGQRPFRREHRGIEPGEIVELAQCRRINDGRGVGHQ